MIKFKREVKIEIDRNDLNELMRTEEAREGVHKAAREILQDAQANLYAMGAVDSGFLHDSGRVVDTGETSIVEFTAPYANIVHEGEGTSSKKGPRPYLTQAAYKDRGQIT